MYMEGLFLLVGNEVIIMLTIHRQFISVNTAQRIFCGHQDFARRVVSWKYSDCFEHSTKRNGVQIRKYEKLRGISRRFRISASFQLGDLTPRWSTAPLMVTCVWSLVLFFEVNCFLISSRILLNCNCFSIDKRYASVSHFSIIIELAWTYHCLFKPMSIKSETGYLIFNQYLNILWTSPKKMHVRINNKREPLNYKLRVFT